MLFLKQLLTSTLLLFLRLRICWRGSAYVSLNNATRKAKSTDVGKGPMKLTPTLVFM